MSEEPGYFACPFCEAYDVDRLYLASLDVDACVCLDCGARWDERRETGQYAGRGHRTSVILPRQR